MAIDAARVPDDPAILKAMIGALQAESAKSAATLRAHDQLVQALPLRIAKLTKQMVGKSSEKIEREIEQREPVLEDLLVAVAEADTGPHEEDDAVEARPSPEDEQSKRRGRPRVSEMTPRGRREPDPGKAYPDCGGDLRVAGEDVSELLDMISAQRKHRNRAGKETLSALREDGASPGTEPPDPGQHGGPGPAGPWPRLEVRRTLARAPPERSLRPHGCAILEASK